MNKTILDASIVLTGLLCADEKKTAIIKKIIKEGKGGKREIWSTDFLSIEVANGLRFSIKDSQLAQEVFEKFKMLPIQLFDLNSHHLKEIMSWSYEMNTTVYETSYHFLSILMKATYFTCDEEYYKKAKQRGSIELIS
jgi:predicted nucleic acid-binding protein